jgi:hypothetical protein
MNRQQLIGHMIEARDIHKQWVGIQTDRRRNGKQPVKNVGGTRWHLKWVTIYDAVVKELQARGN